MSASSSTRPAPLRTLLLGAPLLLLLLLAILAPQPAWAAKDYYGILGVDRKAGERDIKRAYRKLAQKLHPDKHPDKADAFVEVSEAYQILSDDELRSVYDRYGEDAVKKHQAQKQAGGGGPFGAGDPMNIFQQFFGGGGGGFGGGGDAGSMRKGPAKLFNLEVAQADLYRGRNVQIEFERTLLCPACDGSGARSKGDIHACDACNGQGVRVVRQQIMPGFVTNAQVTCDVCGGQGRVVAHACDRCGGNKVVKDQNEIDVEIEPGTDEGEEIVYEGEADETPEYQAGDVVIRIRTVTSKGDFRRRDAHLYLTYPISLAESILGFEHQISHYDGRAVALRRAGVTPPGHVQRVEREGMPRRGGGGGEAERGDLFVEYEVVYPDRVEGDLLRAFETLFGAQAVRGPRSSTPPPKAAAHNEL